MRILVSFFLLYFAGYVTFHFLFLLQVRRPLRHPGPPPEQPWLPPCSILVPAYNEEATILDTVESCRRSRYPLFDIIVINDGSQDGTLKVLQDTYDLAPTPRPPWRKVAHQTIRTVYFSRQDPRLLVIDKVNGGRADALNAGLSYSRHPLIACIDADSLVEPESLLRCAAAFSSQEVVAAGGVVRVLNGCKFKDGVLQEVHLPRSPIATMQVIEYTRAFFVQRPAMARRNALAIISGAFGIFRREMVVALGGFEGRTSAEDMEMVLRIHAAWGKGRQAFVPEPVVWTEVPERWRDLGGQRRRWHRGLALTLWRYRRLLFSRRHPWLGWVILPYFWLYELLEPLVLLLGYAFTLALFLRGDLTAAHALGLFFLPVGANLLLSSAALLLGEVPYGRYRDIGDVLRLIFWTLSEPFWYRWFLTFWRLSGFWSALKQEVTWEKPRRHRKGMSEATSFQDRPRPSAH
ncbi:MAG: glycosyltransferase [Bacillota bacterium]|nr:glycosyltransferase [Bacillota bacterium]